MYEDEGLSSYVLNEDNLDSLEQLLETNYLFINFPPSKFDDYISFLSKIYNHKSIKNIQKIIFISSTSIYPNIQGLFDEEYENSFKANIFAIKEKIEQGDFRFDSSDDKYCGYCEIGFMCNKSLLSKREINE